MPICFELSEKIQEKLDKISDDTERTRSQSIRLAVKQYVENYETKNGKSRGK